MRSFSLKAFAGLQRVGKAVHEPLRGEVQHFCPGIAALHLPGDCVQKMGLAHSDPRVDVEWVIPQGLIGRAFGNLQGRCVCKPVRGADDEGLERVARVERRAFKAVKAGSSVPCGLRDDTKRYRSGRGGQRPRGSGFSRHGRGLQLFNRRQMRLTHPEFQLVCARKFGAAAGEQLV